MDIFQLTKGEQVMDMAYIPTFLLGIGFVLASFIVGKLNEQVNELKSELRKLKGEKDIGR